jgi:hypothetical protein
MEARAVGDAGGWQVVQALAVHLERHLDLRRRPEQRTIDRAQTDRWTGKAQRASKHGAQYDAAGYSSKGSTSAQRRRCGQ